MGSGSGSGSGRENDDGGGFRLGGAYGDDWRKVETAVGSGDRSTTSDEGAEKEVDRRGRR